MGTAKDPRDAEREEKDRLKELDQKDDYASAHTKPEAPKYQITDWASF